MAMASMNLIGVFVTKLWPVQALACGGGGTKTIISPKFSNFGDIISNSIRPRTLEQHYSVLIWPVPEQLESDLQE